MQASNSFIQRSGSTLLLLALLAIAYPYLSKVPNALSTLHHAYLRHYPSVSEAQFHLQQLTFKALVVSTMLVGLCCLAGFGVLAFRKEQMTAALAKLPRQVATTLAGTIGLGALAALKLSMLPLTVSGLTVLYELLGVVLLGPLALLLLFTLADTALSAQRAANPVVRFIELTFGTVAFCWFANPVDANFALMLSASLAPVMLLPIGQAYADATQYLRNDALEDIKRELAMVED